MNDKFIFLVVILIAAGFVIGLPLINAKPAIDTSTKDDSMEDMVDIYDYKTDKIIKMKRIEKSDEQWREELTKDQYHILREEGTERPFTSPLNDNKKHGVYKSAASGVALFHSDQKFNSGTGWPSFYDVIADENIELREDNTLFMKRIEVIDKISGSHLGHVFNDGPAPTGLRYCINGAALIFEETKE